MNSIRSRPTPGRESGKWFVAGLRDATSVNDLHRFACAVYKTLRKIRQAEIVTVQPIAEFAMRASAVCGGTRSRRKSCSRVRRYRRRRVTRSAILPEFRVAPGSPGQWRMPDGHSNSFSIEVRRAESFPSMGCARMFAELIDATPPRLLRIPHKLANQTKEVRSNDRATLDAVVTLPNNRDGHTKRLRLSDVEHGINQLPKTQNTEPPCNSPPPFPS